MADTPSPTLNDQARDYARKMSLDPARRPVIANAYKAGARSRDAEFAELIDRLKATEDESARLRSYLSAGDAQRYDSEAAWKARAEQAEATLARLTDAYQRFAGKVLKTHREYIATDIGGDDIERWALECGLLAERKVTEPCGEDCACAEWDDFPQTCYFLTESGAAAIKAAKE